MLRKRSRRVSTNAAAIFSPVQMPWKRFWICSLWSRLNVLTFFPPGWGMLRIIRSRRVLIFLTNIKNVPHTTQQRYYNEAARQEFGSVRNTLPVSSWVPLDRNTLEACLLFRNISAGDGMKSICSLWSDPKRFGIFPTDWGMLRRPRYVLFLP